MELPVLIALSYFPELAPVDITFARTRSELAFASRPVISSLMMPWKERTYKIFISTQSTKVPEALLFNRLTLNRQAGILGHELSHTVYYLHRSWHEIISTGFKYLFPDYRIKFEKETDEATIRRGLGYQLLDFASYWQEYPGIPQELKRWHQKYYLQPSDILQRIKNIPEYNR